MLGTAFGVLMGPHCAGIFDPRSWGGSREREVTLEVMRIVLATGLFAIGVELPRSYLAKHVKGLCVMVVSLQGIFIPFINAYRLRTDPYYGFRMGCGRG